METRVVSKDAIILLCCLRIYEYKTGGSLAKAVSSHFDSHYRCCHHSVEIRGRWIVFKLPGGDRKMSFSEMRYVPNTNMSKYPKI